MLRRSIFRLITATGKFIQLQVKELTESYKLILPSNKPLPNQIARVIDEEGNQEWITLPSNLVNHVSTLKTSIDSLFQLLKGDLLVDQEVSLDESRYYEISQQFSDSFLIIESKNLDSNNTLLSESLGKILLIPVNENGNSVEVTFLEGFNLIQSSIVGSPFRITVQVISGIQNLKLSIWRINLMALISDIASVQDSVTTLQTNVSSLQTVANQLQTNAAKQVDFQFPAVQPKNQTYNFDFAILQHNLNDLRPSVNFYTDVGDAEILGWKVIDANSIVVNCKGASKQINTNWRIVITAAASS